MASKKSSLEAKAQSARFGGVEGLDKSTLKYRQPLAHIDNKVTVGEILKVFF